MTTIRVAVFTCLLVAAGVGLCALCAAAGVASASGLPGSAVVSGMSSTSVPGGSYQSHSNDTQAAIDKVDANIARKQRVR